MARQVMTDEDDAPELDDAFFAEARPMNEALTPAQQRSFKPRGPQKAPTKRLVSVRLSPAVIDYFKAQGEKGWQARLDATLLEIATGRIVRVERVAADTQAVEVAEVRRREPALSPVRPGQKKTAAGPFQPRTALGEVFVPRGAMPKTPKR